MKRPAAVTPSTVPRNCSGEAYEPPTARTATELWSARTAELWAKVRVLAPKAGRISICPASVVVPTVRVLASPATPRKLLGKLAAKREARAGPTKVRSVAISDSTVPSIVVAKDWRSVTAWVVAPLAGAAEKRSVEPAEPSRPESWVWPFVQSTTLPCRPIEASWGAAVRATSALPAALRMSVLPAAAVICAPIARSVPLARSICRVVFAARLAVNSSVVSVAKTPWNSVEEVPIPLARPSLTRSLPPRTT